MQEQSLFSISSLAFLVCRHFDVGHSDWCEVTSYCSFDLHFSQSWVFIGMTDAKAETPILWPPHAKSWLIGKDSDAGRDWRQEEKGMTEDEMVGWHHQLDRHEFGWTPGVGDGQGGLACCKSWGRKESDTTEWLNWTELNNEWCWASFHMFVMWCEAIYITSLDKCLFRPFPQFF